MTAPVHNLHEIYIKRAGRGNCETSQHALVSIFLRSKFPLQPSVHLHYRIYVLFVGREEPAHKRKLLKGKVACELN